jgi:hypothetical protein
MPGEPPALRLAEPSLVAEGMGRTQAVGRAAAAAGGKAAARDREAAELARRIEAAVGSASANLRGGPASAADQLRAHREQTEEAARKRHKARRLPGVAELGLELAIGALRLFTSMAMAPLRFALAVLRRGVIHA